MTATMGPTNKVCVVVAGMHRSGTSAMSGILNLLGLNLGRSIMPPKEDNEGGFYENMRIWEANNRLLDAVNSSWDGVFPVHDGARTKDGYRAYRSEIESILSSDFDDSHIILVKDPRLNPFFTLFSDILTSRGYTLRFVLIVRNPLEVAVSLEKRDGFTFEKSILLWLYHNLEAEFQTRPFRRVVAPYAGLVSDPVHTSRRVVDSLRIRTPFPVDDRRGEIESFIRGDLRHSRFDDREVVERCPDFVHSLYTALAKMAIPCHNPGEWYAKIDELRVRFFKDRDLFYHREIRQKMDERIKTFDRKLKDTTEQLFILTEQKDDYERRLQTIYDMKAREVIGSKERLAERLPLVKLITIALLGIPPKIIRKVIGILKK
jgi:hypothetical protein